MRSLVFLAIIFLTHPLFASELLFDSALKVRLSDLIAVGEIIDIKLGVIRPSEHDLDARQDVTIRFKIKNLLFGTAQSEITIRCESTYFTTENTFHGSSGGFCSYELKKGKLFLAYLKNDKRDFRLASDSNQFFEHINEASNLIRANGQTSDYVDLQSKLQQITDLSNQKK